MKIYKNIKSLHCSSETNILQFKSNSQSSGYRGNVSQHNKSRIYIINPQLTSHSITKS